MKISLRKQVNYIKSKQAPFLLLLLAMPLIPIDTVMAAGCLKASPVTLQRKAARYAGSIDIAVRKYRIDKELIQAVIAAESCFKRKAVSPAGAQGLMQLMPATADRFGVSDSFNANTFFT